MEDRTMTIAAKLPVAANLDDRIAAAFAEGAKSDDFASLIRDAEAAAITADDVALRARDRALDPAQPAANVATARREMDDAVFRRDRLQVAVKRLGERLLVVRAAEENDRRILAYEKAKLLRDKLAQELTRVYPQAAATLADLMGRIDASDREIAYINSRLPEGAERILVAELSARGMIWFGRNSDAPSIIKDLRLPAFHFDQFAPYTWPRDHSRRGGE
jgi:hypothetical protein